MKKLSQLSFKILFPLFSLLIGVPIVLALCAVPFIGPAFFVLEYQNFKRNSLSDEEEIGLILLLFSIQILLYYVAFSYQLIGS